MAAAYAALLSLLNNLELIQNHPRHSFSFDNKQIESLFENATFFIDFMERYHSHGGSKEDAEILESRIASAANAAEDVIESHVVDQIRGGSTLSVKSTSSFFLPDLQNLIEEMDFVRRKAIKVRKAQSGTETEHLKISAAATSSTPPATVKNTMVGFDGILYKLMDLLTGEPSSRRVIPIVGMGELVRPVSLKMLLKINILRGISKFVFGLQYLKNIVLKKFFYNFFRAKENPLV